MLERQARRTGIKPAALKNRPRLRVTDFPYTEAFSALHSCRTWGAAAPNPISMSELSAYCSIRGIASPSERSKYLRLIQRLDRVYLKHWSDKNPAPGGR